MLKLKALMPGMQSLPPLPPRCCLPRAWGLPRPSLPSPLLFIHPSSFHLSQARLSFLNLLASSIPQSLNANCNYPNVTPTNTLASQFGRLNLFHQSTSQGSALEAHSVPSSFVLLSHAMWSQLRFQVYSSQQLLLS